MRSIAITIIALLAVLWLISLIVCLKVSEHHTREIFSQTGKMAGCGIIIGLATVGLKYIEAPLFLSNIAMATELLAFILSIINPVVTSIRYEKMKKISEEREKKEIWDKVFK